MASLGCIATPNINNGNSTDITAALFAASAELIRESAVLDLILDSTKCAVDELTVTPIKGNNPAKNPMTVPRAITAAGTWSANDTLSFGDFKSGLLSHYGTSGASNLTMGQAVYSTSLVDSTSSTAAAAFNKLLTAADTYITSLSTQRSLLGAYQNQIEFTVSNVTELSANLAAAKSNVVDTDYATETAALTKGQILQQAATAMLAQANQMPNVILSLLK